MTGLQCSLTVSGQASALSALPSRSSLLAWAGGTAKSCLWLDDNEGVVEGSTLNLAMGGGDGERKRRERELCKNG